MSSYLDAFGMYSLVTVVGLVLLTLKMAVISRIHKNARAVYSMGGYLIDTDRSIRYRILRFLGTICFGYAIVMTLFYVLYHMPSA